MVFEKMKKISLIFCILVICYSGCRTALAQYEGGKVILDLKDDAQYDYDQRKFLPTVVKKGYEYIQDVKQYNEQLSGNSIDRDFRDDIKNKYPDYSDGAVESWHDYVKLGVKTVRFFEDAKQKVKNWILSYDLPIVAKDDQYEMGDDEEYIETDKPLIRENFKKIIAYSNSDRDKLAAREKYAKDHNLVRPSKAIKWYRDNIAQGNWKKLIKGFWSETDFAGSEEKDEIANDKNRLTASYVIMMKYRGFTNDGLFEGVIDITPPTGKVALLNDYKQFQGLKLDFSGSDNVENIDYYLTNPQNARSREGRQLLFYGGRFPVYFEGKAQDVTKKVTLHLKGIMNACVMDECETLYNPVDITISPVEKKEISGFATYIERVEKNIPQEKNKEIFHIENAIWEDYGEGMGYVRLEFATNDNILASVYMIGDNARFFAAPNISLNKGKVSARFELLDEQFSPPGKEITFWVVDGQGHSYVITQKVKSESILNVGRNVSAGVWGLALLAGFLLNFMPSILPLFILKFIAFTKYGAKKKQVVRRRFVYDCLGIGAACSFLALGISGLKYFGVNLAWGMQFQSVTLLTLVIWINVYILAYLLGIVTWNGWTKINKDSLRQIKRENWFEFMSGIFIVLLAVISSAPYLSTVVGTSLLGSPWEVAISIIFIGLGLAIPYILAAVYPKIVLLLPSPGKWLKIAKSIVALALIAGIVWLVMLLAMQSSNKQIWHWIIYVLLVLGIAKFNSLMQQTIDKMYPGAEGMTLKEKYRRVCLAVIFLLVVGSFVDVRSAYFKHNDEVMQSKIHTINLQNIDEHIMGGNKVLLKIDANWCLICKYNDNLVLGWEYVKDEMKNNNVEVINIDGTDYDEQILHFMQRYGRSGRPFYVLFSKKFREGIVLPEILNRDDFVNLIGL